MKRPLFILIAGLLLAVGGYCGVYYAGTAKSCCTAPDGNAPELAWLKEEFHLSDADFKHVTEMHEKYLAGCAERCRVIDASGSEDQVAEAILAAVIRRFDL